MSSIGVLRTIRASTWKARNFHDYRKRAPAVSITPRTKSGRSLRTLATVVSGWFQSLICLATRHRGFWATPTWPAVQIPLKVRQWIQHAKARTNFSLDLSGRWLPSSPIPTFTQEETSATSSSGRPTRASGVHASACDHRRWRPAGAFHSQDPEDRRRPQENHGRMGRSIAVRYPQRCRHSILARAELAGRGGTKRLSRRALGRLLHRLEPVSGGALPGRPV